MSLFSWLEATQVAQTIGQSLMLTAWLSATHLIGFTIVMGGAVLINDVKPDAIAIRKIIQRPTSFGVQFQATAE